MYKFIRKNDVGVDVKHKFSNEDSPWPGLVAEFQTFLTDCGYVFAKDFDMARTLWEEHNLLLKEEQKQRERNK